MKKRLFTTATVVCMAAATAFIACKKETSTSQSSGPAKLQTIGAGAPGGSVKVKLSFNAGHPASQCHGQGACFNATPNWFAHWVHIPCQGYGADCHWEIEMNTGVIQNMPEDQPTDSHLPIVDYSGSEFGMPDRSLYIEETNQYLNIPKQIAQKDEEGTYLFTNVVLSATPMFENI